MMRHERDFTDPNCCFYQLELACAECGGSLDLELHAKCRSCPGVYAFGITEATDQIRRSSWQGPFDVTDDLIISLLSYLDDRRRGLRPPLKKTDDDG